MIEIEIKIDIEIEIDMWIYRHTYVHRNNMRTYTEMLTIVISRCRSLIFFLLCIVFPAYYAMHTYHF